MTFFHITSTLQSRQCDCLESFRLICSLTNNRRVLDCVANAQFTPPDPTRPDATKLSRRVASGHVNWVLLTPTASADLWSLICGQCTVAKQPQSITSFVHSAVRNVRRILVKGVNAALPPEQSCRNYGERGDIVPPKFRTCIPCTPQ